MKLFEVSAVILVGLLTLQLVEACGPVTCPRSGPPLYPFNRTNSTNETNEMGIIPISRVLKLGAQRGLRECEKLFNESMWLDWSLIKGRLDPELPIFVNTTVPLVTHEAALLHAISSAAIAYELTLKCRHNIRGCECVKRSPWGMYSGCGDNFEFGKAHAWRLFRNLEKGNGARTAVNRHNNKVGREVVETSKTRQCKCYDLDSPNCCIRTCYMELASFETIIAELKQKFEDAIQVEFRDNKLYDPIRLRPIYSKDSRLVFLEINRGDICTRNESLGIPGMLGRTCRINSTSLRSTRYDWNCEIFTLACKSCNLKPTTAVKFEQYDCNCKFHSIVKCQKCTRRTFVTTCVANDEKPEYSAVSHDIVGRRY